MEIDVTQFFAEECPRDYSASAAELGPDAGLTTWRNATERAEESTLLTTADELDVWRDYVRTWGAWEDDEIDSWSDARCNALFIQEISGRWRDYGLPFDPTDADWRAVEESGRMGNLYRGGDGRIYYWIGS